MTPEQIIEQIWQLPWYNVLWIVVVSGYIFLLKTWPVWICIAVLLGLFAIYVSRIERGKRLFH